MYTVVTEPSHYTYVLEQSCHTSQVKNQRPTHCWVTQDEPFSQGDLVSESQTNERLTCLTITVTHQAGGALPVARKITKQ